MSVAASFVYSENGVSLARVDRVEPGANGRDKDFLPYLALPGGDFAKKPGLNGMKLPLYRVDEVRAAIAAGETIYLVEGEGKGDALRDVLRKARSAAAVTTLFGGANTTLTDAHLASLSGATSVVVLADSDDAGRKAGAARALRIVTVHPTCKVRIADLYLDRTDGSDVADWLDGGHGLDEFRTLVAAAPRVEKSPEAVAKADVSGKPEWGDANPWPVLDDAALYGLAGEIVRIIEPHSEADRAALLAHALVAFGAFVGPGPHVLVEATPQPPRLFALIVGDTANARKGTARNRIEHAFRIADEKTLDAVSTSGLASGEGLIEHLCDKRSEVGEDIPIEKRALVHDSEFARILAVSGREGNTLSAILRCFWDKGEARNMTRKNPLKVRGAHVCLTSDITLDEFAEKMPGLEIANGLLNRFLIVCSKRSKLLPFGGDLSDAELALVAGKLRDAIDEARTRKRLYMTSEARAVWAGWYCQAPRLGGLLAAATARRETQALRLALTYALLDGHDAIDTAHLRAAFAFWDYCLASARHLFGARLGDPIADRLLRALREVWPRGLDGRQIDELFSKSLRAGKVDAVREDLERRNLIYRETEPSGPTGGRPRVLCYANPPPDKLDKPGQTHAQASNTPVCPGNPVIPEPTNGTPTSASEVIDAW